MSGDMARAEVSPEGAATGSGVDVFEQATKALALRTPFEGDDVPPRNPTLPARLVSWSVPEDYRKKHKKAPPPTDEAAAERPLEAALSRPAKVGLWEHFEAYFRPVNLDDVEMLRPKFPLSCSKVDSSMLIPFPGSNKELMDEVQTFDVTVTETSSYLGLGGEEVISKRDHSEPYLIGQKERSSQGREDGIHDVVVQQMVSDKELNRHIREQGIHEVSVQLGERPFEAYEAGRSSGTVSAQCTEEEGTSLNWLLGAKDRFFLTSKRPYKKRKLFGVDAGLEQLVLLPRLGPEVSSCCDVCCLGESSMKSNRILNCSKCKVSVHPKCYGLHAMPDGQWLCAWCTYLESTGRSPIKDAGSTQPMPCVLCPKEKGALKPIKVEPVQNAGVDHVKFVHLFCSLWSPEVFVEDMESMEPVTNIGNIQANRMKLTCSICKIKHGACVRCSYGTCRTPFHPICARESKHQMEIWGKHGHPNVELRAFCLKHSAIGFINSVENNNNASEKSPSESMPINSNLITGKNPKLRFTRKNKDKFMNCETDTSSTGNLISVETIEQGALPHMVRNANAQPIRTWKTDTVHPLVVGDHMRSSGDIAAVLRKLIDSGNVSVGDIASEVGISSESLEAALVGETTTFSHGLKLKIIRWLQTYEHIHADQGGVLKETSVVGQDDKPDGSDATQTVDVKSLMVPDDDKGALDVPGSAVIEPSVTRSKCNDKVLKDKNITCAAGMTILPKGNKNTVKEGPNLECSPGESEFCPIGSKDVSKEEHGKLILNTTSGNIESGTSMDIPNENQGALLEVKSNCLSEAEPGSELEEGVSSLGHCFSQCDKAKTGINSVENVISTSWNHDSDCFHGQLFFNFDDSHSYIHPFIKNKMAHHLDTIFKQDSEASCHHEQPSCPSHGEISVEPSLKLEDTIETTDGNQVLNARSLKILEQSPDDEIEGEILYLQARLLDDAVVLKHRYEKLLAKVVQNLSHELDAFSKRKWNLIIVNQFLRDVREAKKHGKKEKRHKEAQALLAASTAAVASSSRNSTLRKDVKVDVASANQEGSPKLAAGSSSLPRAKDSSKSSNSKVSTVNNFWSFHMPISSKENPLYCDICMRAETVLNRIFVCSRCKAAVHIDCYKNLHNSVGPWTCEFCEDISSEAATISDQSGCTGRKLPLAQCGMCHGTSGAFRKTTDGQWVHAFCAEWLLGTKYVRGQDNLVHGMESLKDENDTCCVCLRNVGMFLRCNSGDCHVTFHPTCARNSGFYMNRKGFGTMPQHKAYCGKHSVEQKEVDARQYEPEELKSMKQMRVELEKLRLLCERIIKREKVKRETVLCDHDILDKTKDTVFSYVASGASSESATTSVNNKSHSVTMQRSDDVTLDSTISGEKNVMFSLNSRDAERNTADSSRTLISVKRKLSERGSLARKQLPQRPAIASQKLKDGGKKTEDKKGTFQKELIMTSDQASTQNQRLPKGYAYVPRDSLSKEKLWNRNVQEHNPEEPSG